MTKKTLICVKGLGGCVGMKWGKRSEKWQHAEAKASTSRWSLPEVIRDG